MDMIKLIVYVLICISVFAVFLNTWVTKDDFEGLPENEKDRLPVLFYFSTTTLSTIGYGDIHPKSLRARMAVTFFMIFAYVASIVGFMQLIKKTVPSA